jgi:hypothetical protein
MVPKCVGLTHTKGAVGAGFTDNLWQKLIT